MFANFPMNSALGGVSMDCVVVGHVSLNKKRAKKNLQKIAHGAPAKRVCETPKACSTPAIAPVPKAQPKIEVQAPQPVAAPLPRPDALATVFTALPEGVLSQIVGDLSSIGAMAAVSRDLQQQVWEDAGFWQCKLGRAALAPREQFRTETFQLGEEWLLDFAQLSATAAPLSVLKRGLEIAQGLMPQDQSASRFVEMLCQVVRQCDATDEAWDLLDAIGLKVAQKEGTVFAAHCLDDLSAAREDLVEHGILQRLDAQVEMDTFDPFEAEEPQPEPQAWVVDGPVPELLLTPAEPAKALDLSLDERSTDDESDSEEYFSVCDDDEQVALELQELEDQAAGAKQHLGLQEDFLDLLR